jgi:hypothetical protein
LRRCVVAGGELRRLLQMEKEVGLKRAGPKSKEPACGQRSVRRAIGDDIVFGSGGTSRAPTAGLDRRRSG